MEPIRGVGVGGGRVRWGEVVGEERSGRHGCLGFRAAAARLGLRMRLVSAAALPRDLQRKRRLVACDWLGMLAGSAAVSTLQGRLAEQWQSCGVRAAAV